MAPIKREGWVNLYKSKDCLAAVGNPFVYDTEEMAKSMVGTDSARKEFIATVKIEWEE